MSENIDKRDYNELNSTIALAKNVIYKEYLGHFSEYNILLPGDLLMSEEPSRCLRMFHLKQLTCKKNEDILQKLSTVYHSAMSLDCNVFLMIDSPGDRDIVNIYVGVRAPDTFNKAQAKALRTSYNALEKGILSNFPGSKLNNISSSQKVPGLLDDIFQEDVANISAVSCVASIRDKDKTEKKDFIQGIEKLIDTMHGKAYTGIFIAEPVRDQEQSEIRYGYQKIYSELSSFRKSTWSYNESESYSVLNNITSGVSKTVTEGITHTQSHTLSHTKGTNNSYNINMNFGGNTSGSNSESQTNSKTSPTGVSRTGAAIKSLSDMIKPEWIFIPGIGKVLGVIKGAGAVGAAMQGTSITDGITKSIGRSLGANIGLGGGYTHGTFSSDSEAIGSADATNASTSNGTIDSTSKGTTHADENGKTLQIEFTNKDIEEILKRIDEQLQRLQECEDYGAYSCGAYFLSSKEENSILAANTYKALLIGKGTSIERGAVTVWNDKDTVTVIKEYLRRFTHPVFALPLEDKEKKSHMVQSPSTIVSGQELPLHLGLPFKSVVGLQVIDHAEFGRNIIDGEGTINIGKLYHMGQIEEDIEVLLDKDSLTKHTFITGSTGSGKSNTIYKMLDELINQDVNFLVIEPTKGEYKSVFGGNKDVLTYGTNPVLNDITLLRINPFRFPKTTHILEHLDRLVEIFNVCWPMYAAMPAILKDSIERAYAKCGWDLEKSKNRYDPELFPTFLDVVRQVKIVLDESDYSSDNKGDYVGSLVTRLRSLSNGINGLIFTTDDISDEDLFDKNAIIDLSRVGSTETKALIMGLLVLRLQEHRMDQRENGADFNEGLKHVTILEEAHNLLKRTSTEQSNESANLLGKSVEMLANSIAEMRTYGEGFIIADQSPGMLDLSVIRNTNTKIIMRLPDFSDRELVGKAAGLNNEQIEELVKLEQGVAAISQNNWFEPILCKIDKYDGNSTNIIHTTEGYVVQDSIDTRKVSESILDCIMSKELYRKGDRVEIQRLRAAVLRSKLDTNVKCKFINYIESGDEEAVNSLRSLVYDFFNADKAVEESKHCDDIIDWVHSVAEKLSPEVKGKGYSSEQINLVMALIVDELSSRNAEYNDILCQFAEVYKQKGGIF